MLCAGLGTRLRPLTEHWPKPAIPLLGQPLLRYALAALKKGGAVSVGVNTHHLPEAMAQVAEVECARFGLGLTVSREPVIQGTGGGIRGLRRAVEGERAFVVWNGDILFALDLAKVVAAHQASGAAATMVLLPMPEGEKYAAVEMEPSGRVVRIAGRGPGGKAAAPWHFTGVHVMSPAVFDFMAPEGEEDINRAVYPKMIEKGLLVRGEVTDAYWSDLGTPKRYLATQQDLLFQRVPVEAFPGASPFAGAAREGNAWVRPGARIEGAGVAGPAFFDAAASVAGGTQIGSAVYVGPHARVGAGARLNRASVLDETEVAAGEEIVDAIAWRRHRIAI